MNTVNMLNHYSGRNSIWKLTICHRCSKADLRRHSCVFFFPFRPVRNRLVNVKPKQGKITIEKKRTEQSCRKATSGGKGIRCARMLHGKRQFSPNILGMNSLDECYFFLLFRYPHIVASITKFTTKISSFSPFMHFLVFFFALLLV